MSRLDADAITVVRDNRPIVDRVSLNVESGQFVGLLGPNGAGKSTLLSTLAGLLRQDAGTVALDGVPLTQIPRRMLARRRAFLPQGPRVEWPVSVERAIALGLTPHLPAFGGLPRALTGQVDAVMDQFDLAGRRDQPVTTLSTGELARAMLARALVGDPDILLADEPLAGLDPRHALDSIGRLRGLADSGKLVVASIHELTLAARYTTHIAVMREGRLVAAGPTASTLTSGLLHDVFDVDACVSDAGTPSAIVDFAGTPAASVRAGPTG